MTPSDPEGLRVAFLVLEVLDRLGVPYHLGGSYASAIHGIPRQTHDVDLVVDLRKDRTHDLAQRSRMAAVPPGRSFRISIATCLLESAERLAGAMVSD